MNDSGGVTPLLYELRKINKMGPFCWIRATIAPASDCSAVSSTGLDYSSKLEAIRVEMSCQPFRALFFEFKNWFDPVQVV